MSQEPRIEERAAQHYAGIQATVPMEGVSGAVDEAFPELFGWLAKTGTAPVGPPFIRFLVIDMEALLQLELGVPVAAPVPESGRIRPGMLPAGRYVVLRHIGDYEGLIDANAALQRWAQDHGLEFDMTGTPEGSAWGSRFEEYITDPSKEPDPAKWETDVAYLLRG
ncbi:MAG TPA: GyrI-like domain-containing protein [Trebonia sp.]|jgi:effector-binding domain-containing protein|nr:GyrI-like domain-containing protein [Trebonia sp.]